LSGGAANSRPQTRPVAGGGLGVEDLGRVIARLDDAAILVDLAGRAILKTNESFLALGHFSETDVATLDLLDLHGLEGVKTILKAALQAKVTDQVLPGVSVTGKGGTSFAADVRVTSFPSANAVLILLTYHVPAPPAAHGAAEGRAAGDLPALSSFTRKLAAVLEHDDLERVLITATSGLFGSDHFVLAARRRRANALEIVASSGIPQVAVEAVDQWLGEMTTSGLLSDDRPRVVETLSGEERLAPQLEVLQTSGNEAFVIFPLQIETRFVGVLAVGFPGAAAARACDLDLGSVFAAHLAGTLEGVLLLERSHKEKSHHEVLNRIISWLRGPLDFKQVLRSLTAELGKTLEADRCLILIADAGEEDAGPFVRIEEQYGREGKEPLKTKEAIRFGSTSLGPAVLLVKEPLVVEDLQMRLDLVDETDDVCSRLDLRSFIMAKIVSREEFVGLVAVGMSDRPCSWMAEQIDLVRAVADHAAVTLETERHARASRERAEQIDRERREWERTFDAIPDMVSIHDGYDRLLRTNLALQTRLGEDASKYVGQGCAEILNVILGSSSDCPHTEALAARRALSREVTGERGVFSLTAIPCFDTAGACLYIIHVLKEVTEEKQIREQLLQSEKLAAVGRLVAGVAHELNNPLAGVIGFSELLLGREQDPESKKRVQQIKDEGERASRIVRNLLAFARKHTPESVPTDINAILGKTVELRAYELKVDKIDVSTDLAPDLPPTVADPNQLLQVFMNIVTNAEQAMKEAHGKGLLKVSSSVVGETIRVTFEDDGPGIPPDNVKKIFDPFFTTKVVGKGSGLGLSICHGIIKEHGGTISVNSTVGQGTTFTIELPVVSGPSETKAPQRATPTTTATRARPATILVVDDEAPMREMIRAILEMRGHTVDAAESGLAGLEAISGKTYDVVLSDMKMPGMDGRELLSRLTSEHPDIASRVVFISGDTASAETHTFFRESGRPYVLKPFKASDLVEAVEKIIPAAPPPDKTGG
jgi:signal transduction histidine kinase/GAF domain-containing protein/ActR/RegA family two-component response regulator